jgi:hypothetical protein
MIDISTDLSVFHTGFDGDFVSHKQIVMRMDRDSALALATILFNNQSEISDDWKSTIDEVARQLLRAGNKCR